VTLTSRLAGRPAPAQREPEPGSPRRRALVAALGASALLPGCTMIENFFFYPDATAYTMPSQFGLRHEDVFFAAPDGSRLHGWWLPALRQPARASVLHLHGNAANITNHLPLAAWLPPAGFNLLMFDYRGFGRSEGRPTLAGVVEDAQAALALLRARPEVDANRLVVFGQSLGGATALRLLARDAQGVRAAVIDAAFASYRGIARDAAAGPLALLLPVVLPSLPPAADDPIGALAHIRLPLLYVHGSADRVVPVSHTDALAAATPGPHAVLRVDGAQHMEPLQRPPVQHAVLERLAGWL
jgi:fermentation-respiration switch protein FrsA (DUF1100 family)